MYVCRMYVCWMDVCMKAVLFWTHLTLSTASFPLPTSLFHSSLIPSSLLSIAFSISSLLSLLRFSPFIFSFIPFYLSLAFFFLFLFLLLAMLSLSFLSSRSLLFPLDVYLFLPTFVLV